MARKIVVVGSSNVDLIMKMDHLPRLGETVTNAIFLQTFGGKGANTAVGTARAGGEVYFVTCVGDDSYGHQSIENLSRLGVHLDGVFTEQQVASGTALIMVDSQGQNYLSVAPGANYRLSPQHIDRAAELIHSAEMVLLQYEILPETLKYVIDLASRAEKKILLNLAPARPLEDEYLAKLSVLVVNETEAEFLCGFPVDTADHIHHAAESLLAKGPGLVIITLGAQGAYFATQELRMHAPGFKVKAVDSTAAGDIFCGSLAVALVEGKSVLESVRFANAAAAISVTRLGAQPSAPGRHEIERFLSQY